MDERILNKKKIDKKKIQSKKVQSSKEVDVSDKKKEKTAVALAYEPGDKAPKMK